MPSSLDSRFGALPAAEGGVQFRVHAPEARELCLILHGGPARGEYRLSRGADGIWNLLVREAAAGQHYSYRIDGSDPRPDPASRFQPHGVHGPSEVVAPERFRWTDDAWQGPRHDELVVYELHVGTFSRCGTFRGAIDHLPDLRDLGVTAIELMPVADFAGARNWGYDGVALFAPSRAYGRPDDLRALVDRAHALGLAVILDVVYNHLGPEGAYLPAFNPQYLLSRYRTPWGAAVNLDGPGCEMVRRFITENAVHWIREYHLDGLRFDATHALIDGHPVHFMRELATAIREHAEKPVILHAEDERNLNTIAMDDPPGGWGLDGVWADDFHHVLRRMVAGDRHGYYADFEGTSGELARTLRQGWLYTGQQSAHMGTIRGTDASRVPMSRVIACVQNHDQIGNRALGERLHHQIDAATWRAISTLLLTAPMTPLLFMGQEWAATTPFQFFTDLEPDLGRLVTAGRRNEFRGFPEYSTPDAAERIPDPQALATFDASRLRWNERGDPAHAAVLALYRRLLHLRCAEAALRASEAPAGEAFAAGEDTVVVRRSAGTSTFWIAARLRGAGTIDFGGVPADRLPGTERWEMVLTTEEPAFSLDPLAVRADAGGGPLRVTFGRPGAAIMRLTSER
jgi:maltooligosyltrehalose trehalohydrolase